MRRASCPSEVEEIKPATWRHLVPDFAPEPAPRRVRAAWREEAFLWLALAVVLFLCCWQNAPWE